MAGCSLSKSEESEISVMSYARLFILYDKQCFRIQKKMDSFYKGIKDILFFLKISLFPVKKLNPGKVCLISDHLAKPRGFYFYYVLQKMKILYFIKHKTNLNKIFAHADSMPRRICESLDHVVLFIS